MVAKAVDVIMEEKCLKFYRDSEEIYIHMK